MKVAGNVYSQDDVEKEMWCKRYVSRRGEANVILQRQRGMITFSAAKNMKVRKCREICWQNTLEKYIRNTFKIREAKVILERQRRMITFSGTACCYIHGSEKSGTLLF